MLEDANAENIRCLRIFERCRLSYGHSVKSIYRAVNLLDTETVPLALLSENLHLYLNIEEDVSRRLAHLFDARNRKEVALEDLENVLEKFKSRISMHNLINEHPFFPTWLTKRADFCEFFADWTTENGAPNATIVEMALRNEHKKAGDLQLIFKWIKIHKILANVKDARLLEVCKSFEYLEVRPCINIVTQGDHGDAFYIILLGSCAVLINNLHVGTISQGMSFGEKALENDAPRAATIKALETCKLMVLRSSEYKSLVATAQAKLNTDTVEFIHGHCLLFKQISYARLFHMVKSMVRKTFKEGEKIFTQGEDAGGLFIVVNGKVDISRMITNSHCNRKWMKSRELVAERDVIGWLRNARETQRIEVKVHAIRSGEVFGDDVVRCNGRSRCQYRYTATAVSNTEIITVNKTEALRYFEGKLLSIKTLYAMTNLYHDSDESLLKKHRVNAAKIERVTKLKKSIFGMKYSDRVHEKESHVTRSISTPALLSHQSHNNNLKAHFKYTKKVLEHMNAPLDRKKIRRRSSLITFLASKSKDSQKVFVSNDDDSSGKIASSDAKQRQTAVNFVPSFT